MGVGPGRARTDDSEEVAHLRTFVQSELDKVDAFYRQREEQAATKKDQLMQQVRVGGKTGQGPGWGRGLGLGGAGAWAGQGLGRGRVGATESGAATPACHPPLRLPHPMPALLALLTRMRAFSSRATCRRPTWRCGRGRCRA